MMSRLLELIRKRRAELQAQGLEHLGPITDEHRIAALRGVIADAQHDPAAAELLREFRASSPEVAALVDEIEAEMEEEARASRCR
jgi:transposase